MDEIEDDPTNETNTELGPEAATRRLAVAMGRKVLSDIVLGFSSLTVIGVLKVLQSQNDSIVLFILENATTATLSIWLIYLLLSVFPNTIYERMNTLEKFSLINVAMNVVGVLLWYAIFFFVSRFVTSTVAELSIMTGN